MPRPRPSTFRRGGNHPGGSLRPPERDQKGQKTGTRKTAARAKIMSFSIVAWTFVGRLQGHAPASYMIPLLPEGEMTLGARRRRGSSALPASTPSRPPQPISIRSSGPQASTSSPRSFPSRRPRRPSPRRSGLQAGHSPGLLPCCRPCGRQPRGTRASRCATTPVDDEGQVGDGFYRG